MLRFLGFIAAGLIIVSAPFTVYFLCVGHFQDFISEYFVNTFHTVREMQGVPGSTPDGRLSGLKFLMKSREWLGIVFKIILILVAWLPFKLYKSNTLRASIWVYYLIVAILSSVIIHEYYLNNLTNFAFFGVVSIISYFPRITIPGSILTGGAMLLFTVMLENSEQDKMIGEFSDVESAVRKQE